MNLVLLPTPSNTSILGTIESHLRITLGESMESERILSDRELDGLLKAMLVFSRTADHVLENRAIEEAGERLSGSKVQILRLLGQRGLQTSGQVARFLGVTKPAVTQIIESLVTARLVSRRQSQKDRRGIELALTTRGKRVFEKIRHQQRHVVRNTVRALPEKDTERWISTLQELSNALARADRAFRGFCLQCGAHDEGNCVLTGGNAHCVFLEHHPGSSKPRSRRRATVRRARK